MLFTLLACTQYSSDDYAHRPLRILFIGNSLTHYNGGLDYLLRKMFAHCEPKLLIYSDKVAPGGEHLSEHYAKGNAMRKIKDRNWDIVVLQEYSNGSIVNKSDFFKYSKNFVEVIRSRGTKPLFYLTFSYKDNPEMLPLLLNSYKTIARNLDCEIVPVGIAWQKVCDDRRDIELYTDFKHPSKNGTYLIASVFFSYLTGEKASVSTFTDGVKPEIAEYLQDIAWETVSNWKSENDK